MAKMIKGRLYWYIGTDYDDEFIYDLYQDDETGKVYKKIIGTRD